MNITDKRNKTGKAFVGAYSYYGTSVADTGNGRRVDFALFSTKKERDAWVAEYPQNREAFSAKKFWARYKSEVAMGMETIEEMN